LVLTVSFSTPAAIIATGSSGQVGGISRPGAHSDEVAKVIDGCFSFPSNVPRRVPQRKLESSVGMPCKLCRVLLHE
jgi:hypothetical protein